MTFTAYDSDGDSETPRVPGTGEKIVRWVLLLPGAIAGAFVAFYVVTVGNNIGSSIAGFDPEALLNRVFTVYIGNAAFSAGFVFLLWKIAPTHKRITSLLIGGIAFLGYLTMGFFDVIQRDWWNLLGEFANLCGTAAVGIVIIKENDPAAMF